MSDLENIVLAIANALNADAGVDVNDPEARGYAVMLTTLSPDGKVETLSNMQLDAYREFFRFIAAETAVGGFSVEEIEVGAKQ